MVVYEVKSPQYTYMYKFVAMMWKNMTIFISIVVAYFITFLLCQYPMDKNKGVKIPVQLRINMWLGLSAYEKKFNSFSEGNFSVYAEMVQL